MKFSEYEAPCGKLLIGVHGNGICLCDWMTGSRTDSTLRRIKRFLVPSEVPDDETLPEKTIRQLDAYFSGTLRRFEIPVLETGTLFQRRVWVALGQIPYGKTVSYKEVASAIGMPHGVRAVAAAIGANPLSLIIPCHRVLGADGSLTGYAGGLKAKRYLLALEASPQSLYGLTVPAL